VIREHAERTPVTDGAPSPEPIDTFEVAIADVAKLTLALTSATTEHAYSDGVYLRGELEHALCRVQVFAEHIGDGSQRAEALRQLAEMHAVATRALMIAPAPSSAAIEAAEAGDPIAWNLEKQAWIAGRLASGSVPRLPAPGRECGKIRPESRRALHDNASTAHDTDDARPSSAVASRLPDKAGRQ